MGVLKHYHMKIEAISPIHIGNGEKLGKKEYIYLPWDSLVIVPDVYRLYGDLQKKGNGQAFMDYFMKNNRDALGSWLKQLGYQKKDYQLWKRYELSAGDVFLTGVAKEAKAKEIACFVKDAYGMPYVPGSSLKGMIRTAMLAWEIKNNSPAYVKIARSIRNNVGKGGRNTLSSEAVQLEATAFHTLERPGVKPSQAVCCNLSGLVVSDSRPIPIKQLVLSQKIDYTLDGKEKPLPILRETLAPGTEIYFDLTIDPQVCPYSVENIMQALESFRKLCYEQFYRRFQRGGTEEGTIWLGGGVGFLSKTVLYPIFGPEAYRITNQVFLATLAKNYNKHKHQKDLSLRISPHVCKCTKYGGKLYDMGMGRIEVLESQGG